MVLVFKTSIENLKQAGLIATALNSNAKIQRWNFDLEDIDNILRIETEFEIENEIIHMVRQQNFYCEELC
ncbi:MAG: hypothetical protein ABIQ88_15260 [Chitinophagaceae bacterium]